MNGSYLATLRQFLFGSSRHACSHARARRRSTPHRPSYASADSGQAHHASAITRHFLLESLESRVLLNATPLVLPVEAIVESPAEPVADSAQSGTAAPLVQFDGSVPGSALSTQHSALASSYGAMPLSFEVNQGQVDASVEFLARGQGYSLFLTGTEAVLSLRSSQPSLDNSELSTQNSALAAPAVLRLTLEGANPSPLVTGLDPLEGVVNYFVGDDPSQWRTGIETYAKVTYDEVYDGIDLVFYGNQRQLEYDWIVAPGADASQIGLGIEGASSVTLDAEGALQLVTVGGTVELQKPYAYQVIGGTKQTVAASYVLSSQQSALSDQFSAKLSAISHKLFKHCAPPTRRLRCHTPPHH